MSSTAGNVPRIHSRTISQTRFCPTNVLVLLLQCTSPQLKSAPAIKSWCHGQRISSPGMFLLQHSSLAPLCLNLQWKDRTGSLHDLVEYITLICAKCKVNPYGGLNSIYFRINAKENTTSDQGECGSSEDWKWRLNNSIPNQRLMTKNGMCWMLSSNAATSDRGSTNNLLNNTRMH